MKSIIMNATDINALLAGQKSQHRVPINPQPPANMDSHFFDESGYGFFHEGLDSEGDCFDAYPEGDTGLQSPFLLGDTIYVKETWAYRDFDSIMYKASYKDDKWAPKWRSPLVMPEWASRIKLKIVSVKVERVQYIDRLGAKLEGFLPSANNGLESFKGQSFGNAELAFKASWDDRYAKKGFPYSDNPWCWVYGIERSE